MINRIFLSTKKPKKFFGSVNYRSNSLGNSLEERHKLSEIKLISNLSNMKLNQNYIDKCTLLLYTCHRDKNYSYKRKNIDKAIYQYDENNGLCITLPKLNEDQKNDENQSNEVIIPKKKYKTIEVPERHSISRNNIFGGNKLKKNALNKNTILFRDNSQNHFLEHMALPKILTNSNIFSDSNMRSNRVVTTTTNQNKKSDMMTISNYGLSKDPFGELRNNQKKIFSYISELNSINSKENSNSTKYKNRYHNNVYYQNIFINNQKNESQNLYTLNKKNKKEDEEKLNIEDPMQKMKSDIYKLHEESSKAEDDVKTTIQKIDTFLNKKELSTTGILQSKNNHLKSKSQLKVKYIIP